jgi:hypothetical protein
VPDEHYAAEAPPLNDHIETYHWFLELIYQASFHLANTLVALAIGGVEKSWPTAAVIIVLASVFAVYGLRKRVRLPPALLFALSLVLLGLHL